MLVEFASRLHTNYVPSDREISQIKQLLIKPRIELFTLEKEIQRVQGLLNDLLLKRDALQGTLKAHEALISIPRRLPQDILQEIFLHCLPTDRNAVMSCKEAPLLLGRTCSNWRMIVYATPQLWSSIHISVFESGSLIFIPDRGIDCQTYQTLSHRIAVSRTQAVRDWLNRTGSCPLSISYYTVPGLPQWNGTGYEMFQDHIIKILLAFSRQWRDMYFSVPAKSCQELLCCLSTGDVQLLRSLSVTATGMSASQTLQNMSTAPIITPDIRSLSFFPIPNMATFKYLAKTCWSRLTRLSLNCDIPGMSTSLKLSTTLSVLRHCPLITHFWLVITHTVLEPVDHRTLLGPSVTLTHLRSMIISSNAVNVQEFLDLLILPSLSSLAIHGQMENIVIIPLSVNPFLSHIGKQITLLTISCSNESSQEDLHRCMSYMPLVKKFHIVEYDWFTMPLKQFVPTRRALADANYPLHDKVLKMLTPSKDFPAAAIWPNLETLESDVDAMVTMEVILDFLEARNGKADVGIAQIKRLKLTINILIPRIDGDNARVCESRIAKLRSDGVEVDISWAKVDNIRSLSAWYGIETTEYQEW